MSQKRAFIIANLLLAAASGFFVYYLAASAYVKPPEIAVAEDALAEIEDVEGTPPQNEAQQTPVTAASLEFMKPLITLTPQPTDSPKPSPTPVPLKLAIQTWTVVSLDETVVTVQDAKNGDQFDLTLNGPPKQVTMDGGSSVSVTLCRVSLDDATATFCGNGQEETKSF